MKRHLKWAGLTLALATFAAALPLSAQAQGRPDLVAASLKDASKSHVPGEMLVQFQRGVSEQAKDAALRGLGARLHQELRMSHQRLDGKGDLHLVKLPTGLTVAAAMRELQRDSNVDFVEPNWTYRTQVTSNDPQYTSGALWGMYGALTSPANQYGSGAAVAWGAGHTCNANVYVGIIDEGYMFNHEDLAGSAWTNPFDGADTVDNDGNGYADDIHGWDFAGNDNSTFDGVGDDHGTHVAGTIAGTGGNTKGVAGVCWTARLISAKFLGSHGGTTANAVLAVDYLTDLKSRHGLNLVASNNSWGGGGFSQALKDAIDRAGSANILFVAAAGNDGANIDVTASYPAGYDSANIISVAAIDKNGALASFSNYGVTKVDIGAPGVAIVSSVPVRSKGQVISGYASYSGTSMATPHVTGAAALYASTHSGATAAQIKAAILGTAKPTPSLNGKVATGGRLDVSGF